jgi:hypothetical protein
VTVMGPGSGAEPFWFCCWHSQRVALVVNLSQPARAAVRGMSYQYLLRDPDFTRAVKTIPEQCSVNVDIAKLKCQGG